MKHDDEAMVAAFSELIGILRRLRAPDGCPWDRKQTEKTMAPLLLEEAFEAADAIDAGDVAAMSEELGDLSMNLFLIALIAEEQGRFDLAEVFGKISRKLVNRHPHVFGDSGPLEEGRFLKLWEEIKREERSEKQEDTSAVAGVPKAMPALLRGLRLLEKMKRAGAEPTRVRDSGERIMTRLESILENEGAVEEADAGSLLLGIVGVLAERGVNPEMALRSALGEVERRFRAVEARIEGDWSGRDSREIDRLWGETRA